MALEQDIQSLINKYKPKAKPKANLDYLKPRIPDVPSRADKAIKKRRRLTIKKPSYDVQSVQSVPRQERGRLEANRITNQAVLRQAYNQRQGLMQQQASQYANTGFLFNSLPTVTAAASNPILQGLINRGSPAVQQSILRSFGVRPGAGFARAVDQAIQGAGSVGLNFGSHAFFQKAPDQTSFHRPSNASFSIPGNNRFRLGGNGRTVAQNRMMQFPYR